eukprot:761556-Hanusia_phi.AAC.4
MDRPPVLEPVQPSTIVLPPCRVHLHPGPVLHVILPAALIDRAARALHGPVAAAHSSCPVPPVGVAVAPD